MSSVMGRLTRDTAVRLALTAPAMQFGGQAVIDGVMMRGAGHWAVAVRRPDGSIARIEHRFRPVAAGRAWMRLPVLRGIVALVETLVIGSRALALSADAAAGGAEGAPDATGSRTAVGVTLVVSLAIAVALFLILPLLVARSLVDDASSTAFWAVEGAARVAILVAYLLMLSRMGDLRRMFQYHAAEHMALHAHEAGDPVTPAAAATHPKLHVRCGTAFLLVVVVVSILVFVPLGDQPLWMIALTRLAGIPLVAGLAYEVIRWAGRRPGSRAVAVVMAPALWLQLLTTRTPDTGQLEVACAALRRIVQLESTPPEWAGRVEVMA